MIVAALPLVEVRLYGFLRARFGKSYRLAIGSAAEAVRALCSQLPGFERAVLEHEPGFRVWSAGAPIEAGEQLQMSPGQLVRIVPAIAGRAGIGKVLGGLALIGLSFALGPEVMIFGHSVASMALNLGLSMALGGISQMLAGNPQSPVPAEAANNEPSFTFNGPVNTTAQGNAVPVCLGGPIRVGSQVISSGLSVAQLK